MKKKRQEKLLELIRDTVCLTQEDLQNGLSKMGFKVTQSTVSRDIRELKLLKGRDNNGNYRYLVNINQKADANAQSHYNDLFSKAVKQIKYSLNNVVINCYNGMASSACVALDELYGDMMLGSLAGDDTIIIVTKNEQDSKVLCDSLNKLL